jgi:hypothetical protein
MPILAIGLTVKTNHAIERERGFEENHPPMTPMCADKRKKI